MAEDLGNQLCTQLGLDKPCVSASIGLLSQTNGDFWRPTARYEASELKTGSSPVICECEQVSLEALTRLLEDDAVGDLHALRCRTRLGFGPCQGTFCANRAASLLAEARPERPAMEDLEAFWKERLKGMTPTAWHDQARQTLLSDLVHRDLLGLRPALETAPWELRR
jgi:glycerol-3-phosphate dehydrogenase